MRPRARRRPRFFSIRVPTSKHHFTGEVMQKGICCFHRAGFSVPSRRSQTRPAAFRLASQSVKATWSTCLTATARNYVIYEYDAGNGIPMHHCWSGPKPVTGSAKRSRGQLVQNLINQITPDRFPALWLAEGRQRMPARSLAKLEQSGGTMRARLFSSAALIPTITKTIE